MSETASLSYSIDSSQVRRGTQDLNDHATAADRMGTSYDAVTQRATRFIAETANLEQRLAAQRQQFQQTTQSLQDMIQRMDDLRQSMNDSASAMSGFSTARAQVEALGLAYNQTSTSMEAYTRQAQQLGFTSDQTVASLQRITDALQNQSAAGQSIRRVMQDFGVTLSGLGVQDASRALQQFSIAIQGVADSQQKLRAVQAVLGPVSPTTYAALSEPSYVPVADRRQQQIAQVTGDYVGSTSRTAAMMGRQAIMGDAAYSDLGQYYNLGRYSVTGLGSTDRAALAQAAGVSQDQIASQAGQLRMLQYLQSNPTSDLARRAGTYSASLIPSVGSEPNWYQRTFDPSIRGANTAMIQSQYDLERQQSTGLFGSGIGTTIAPFLRAQGRDIANRFGLYSSPAPSLQTGAPDPDAIAAQGQATLQQLSEFGMGGMYGDRLRATTSLRNLQRPDTAALFDNAYGTDGARSLNNIILGTQRQGAVAMVPGQAGLDANARQSWLLGVPAGQRAQAQALLSWTQQNAPDVNTGLWTDQRLSLGSLLDPTAGGPGALGSQNISSFNRFFAGQVANAGTSADQDSQQAISRQQQLTQAVSQGSAALQELTTRWQAYDAVVGKVGDVEARREAEQKLLEVQEQQKTEAAQLLDQLNQQNQAGAITGASVANAGSDPAARVAAGAASGIYNDYVAAARKDPQLKYADYMAQRQAGLGVQAGNSADQNVASAQHELTIQQQLLSVSSQRADVQAKMARDQQVDQQFSGPLGQAQASGNNAMVQQIEDAIAKAKQLRDEIAQVNATAALFKIGSDNAQSAANLNYLAGVDPSQRGLAQAQLPVALQAGAQALIMGGPGPSMDMSIGRGRRDNNPLNLQYNKNQVGLDPSMPFDTGPGGTGHEARFQTLGLGVQAAATQLGIYQDQYGINTLAGLITKWAPPNENDTAGYIRDVAGMTGIDPNQTINIHDPSIMSKVLSAMSRRDSGMTLDPALVAAVTGGTIDPAAAMNAARSTPQGQAAMAGVTSNYQAGINLQGTQLTQGFGARTNQFNAGLPFLANGQTGAAALARAGVITDPSDPLGGLRAQQAVAGASQGQQQDAITQVASLQQQTQQAQELAKAYAQGQDAVDALTASFKAQAIAMKDNLGPAQTANLTQLEAQAQQAQANANLGKSNLQSQQSDYLIQSQLNIGPVSQRTMQQQMAAITAQQTAANSGASPEAQDQYIAQQKLNEQMKETLQDQQSLQQGFTQMGDAITNSFISAVTSGGNLRQTLGGLASDLAKIALQVTISKPLENMFSDSLGALFGTSAASQAQSVATNTLSGFQIFGSARGNVFSNGLPINFFGSGGIIDSPTTWRMANGGVAQAGEMDSEAVMPLKRLANGNLGVATSGGGGSSIQVNTPVTINAGGGMQGGQLDQRTAMALQKQIETGARAAVKATLADERRPGGDLYFGGIGS